MLHGGDSVEVRTHVSTPAQPTSKPQRLENTPTHTRESLTTQPPPRPPPPYLSICRSVARTTTSSYPPTASKTKKTLNTTVCVCVCAWRWFGRESVCCCGKMAAYVAHPYYSMKPMHQPPPAAYQAYFTGPHHPPPHPALAAYNKVGGLMDDCGRVGWNPNHRLSPASSGSSGVIPSYRPAWDMDTLKASIRCCQAGCGEVSGKYILRRQRSMEWVALGLA